MDIQKEIDAKLAACDAEIESRKAAFTLALRALEDESDANLADKKAEAEKFAAFATSERRAVEHLQESRHRIEQDIATLKLTLPELRAELEAVQEQNKKNLEDHQVRLTNLRVSISEAQAQYDSILADIASAKTSAEKETVGLVSAVDALLVDVNSLTATKARLNDEVERANTESAAKTAELNAIIADCTRAQQRFTAMVEEQAALNARSVELKAKLSELELTVAAQQKALVDIDTERKRVKVYEQVVAERELAVKADAARLNMLKESLNKKEKDLAALGLQVK